MNTFSRHAWAAFISGNTVFEVNRIDLHLWLLATSSILTETPLGNISEAFAWSDILILISWDIELNPGPQNDLSPMMDLSICHINVRSIKATYNGERLKLDLIRNEISKSFNIITLSETWLTNNDNLNNFEIQGFQPPFVLNRSSHAGGVPCWVKNGIAAKRRYDIEVINLEALWLEVRCNNQKFLLCTVYRPPNVTSFYDDFQISLDNALQSPNHLIIIGDLNSDLNTNMGNKLKAFAHSNRLTIYINQPTRITERSSSVLDQCLTNCPALIKNTGVLPPLANNDQCTIFLNLKLKYSIGKSYRRQIWKFSDADIEGYKGFLSSYNWDSCFSPDKTVDQSCDLITQIIFSAAKKYIPNKIVMIRPNDKSFYNNQLRQMKRKLNRLHNKAKNSNTPECWEQFRFERNLYLREVQKAKKEFLKQRNDALQNEIKSPKRFYSLAKNVLSASCENTIPSLATENGDIIVNDQDKANYFNKFFESASVLDDSSAKLPQNDNSDVRLSLDSIIDGEDEVLDQLKILDCNKSYGPDSISPHFIKLATDALVKPLTQLYNLSLCQGVFPSAWKRANVVPIHKKSSKQLADNYRPVSSLSILGKIFERIYKHIYNFFLENSLISKWQSGFLSGLSTVTQLLELYHYFSTSIKEGEHTRIVYLDISKAFDRVWHKGLLYKLKKNGINGTLLKWLSDYLCNRYQRVIINGQFSDWLQ